jgi:subtilase family serine protease
VAANADPNTGYAVYTISSRGVPGWTVMGGTSASAPVWAGFTALVSQSIGKRVGFLNPTLYELGQKASTFAQSPFHDVTTGDNLYYPATQGWDFATGWGSFDGAAFVADVKTLPQAPTTSTPLPTATASPTPSPTPQSVKPTLTINKVLLLHRVAGKLVVTTRLKVGETGTLVILYTRKNASSLPLSGTITVRENGKVVRVVAAGSTTYQGRPALTVTLKFTNAKRVGTLSARVTLSLGTISAALNHVFKLSAG